MLILRHFLHLVIYCGLFLGGSLLVAGDHKLAGFLVHGQTAFNRLCKFFLYSGRTFQSVAAVFGFVEVVALMLLISGWVLELCFGY